MNNFKRISLSIKEHKKDSILIFIIVLILTTFMMIYWTFYKVSEEFSSSIKDNTKVTITLENKTSLNTYENQLLELFDNHKEKYNLYKNQLLYFVNFIDSLSDETKNIESHALLYCEFVSNAFSKNYINNIDVYSGDESLFDDEDFIITQGRYLYDNDINKIIVNEDLLMKLNDETLSSLNIGDIVTLTNSNNETFEYEIVGLFKNKSTKTIIDENNLYDKNTSAILLTKDLINMIDVYDSPQLTKGIVTLVGEQYSNVLINFLNSNYKSITISGDGVEYEMSYSLTYDNSLITKLNKPINNLTKLFQSASIITILIMFLLLFNFLNLIVYKRKHDMAIFISIGQSKIRTMFNFFLEILLISNLVFILSIPIGNKIASSNTENMIISNINKQELMAEIAGNESIDELEISKMAYKDYNLEIDLNTCLIVYISSITIVFISSIYSLIKISLISPKELLIKW